MTAGERDDKRKGVSLARDLNALYSLVLEEDIHSLDVNPLTLKSNVLSMQSFLPLLPSSCPSSSSSISSFFFLLLLLILMSIDCHSMLFPTSACCSCRVVSDPHTLFFLFFVFFSCLSCLSLSLSLSLFFSFIPSLLLQRTSCQPCVLITPED